ncbi:MAG: 30S ribosomal protein S8 [Candidatus Kapabacteria bacterium]|nr:30S ribosomal protein S8 [Candidatus Kapabacteria bacterium]
MPVTDTISDFLIRIKNAGIAKHKTVDIPYSKLKYSIAGILKEQGFISDFEKIDDGVQGLIRITLRYYQGRLVIKRIQRVSKPGRRVYATVDKLPRVYNGLGLAVISTSKGVLTDKEARKLNIGGEVLFTVW